MVWGLLGAIGIGLSLGLLGAGGSILTVPILRYVLGWNAATSITGSLFIVGGISAASAVQFALARRIDWRSAVWFGIPGMAGAFLAGHYLPGLLDSWFPERSDAIKLSLFAVVMLLASVLMFRPPRLAHGEDRPARARWKIAIDGLAVGGLTGLVGVGGGFLIVPTLVLWAGLPMAAAVGTSLFVIVLKSVAGFAGYMSHVAVDPALVGAVSAESPNQRAAPVLVFVEPVVGNLKGHAHLATETV